MFVTFCPLIYVINAPKLSPRQFIQEFLNTFGISLIGPKIVPART